MISLHCGARKVGDPAVKMTALRWSGAMVLVVLVGVRSEIPTVYRTLQEIHEVVEAEGRCRLNIQVVMEDGFKDDEEELRALYPINGMRNMALRMVTTELILMIDADLVPSPGLHEHLTQDEDKYAAYVQRATERNQVLVVPAFAMIQDRSIPYRESIHALPHSRWELRESWWNGILDCFQCDVSPPAHSPTDYPMFTDPAVDHPYDVKYTEGYEPFFIAAVDRFPIDHACWQRAEDVDSNTRPSYQINATSPGSDVAGEAAAASIVFLRSSSYQNKMYAALLLSHSTDLFNFANTNQGLYSESFPAVQDYYNSTGFEDELLWAASWLYQATGDSTYINYVTRTQGQQYVGWSEAPLSLINTISIFVSCDPMESGRHDLSMYCSKTHDTRLQMYTIVFVTMSIVFTPCFF